MSVVGGVCKDVRSGGAPGQLASDQGQTQVFQSPQVLSIAEQLGDGTDAGKSGYELGASSVLAHIVLDESDAVLVQQGLGCSALATAGSREQLDCRFSG